MSTAANQPAPATAGERGAFTQIDDGLLADCNSAALSRPYALLALEARVPAAG